MYLSPLMLKLMEKNYTYSQLQVWQSACDVSKKIFNLTHYFPEEEAQELVEAIRQSAESLPTQVASEIMEETKRPFEKSIELLNMLEGHLVNAFDQGCITERELKTSLEATNIYFNCLTAHRNDEESQLVKHLNRR